MSKIYKKRKGFLAIAIVLAMVFQFVSPIVSDYAYAQDNEEVEQNTDETTTYDEDGDTPQDGEDEEDPENVEDAEDGEDESEEGDLVDPDDSDDDSKDPEDQEDQEDPEGEKEDGNEDNEKDEGTVEDEERIDLSELEEANQIVPLAEPKDLGNIFTFDSFKVGGVEADENQVVVIGDGTEVFLSYTWNVTGANPGDFAEIEIPPAFKVAGNFEDPKSIILSTGENVGTYKIVDNILRFDFTEGIAEVGGNVENGVLGFEVKFNEERFQEDVVEEIEFNDKEDKKITIIGKPSVDIKSINKEGIPDSDKDAKTIKWKVDLTNPSDTAITDAKLKDILPGGLELDPDSIKVNNLNIGLDGTLSPGSEVTGLSPTIDGQNLELDLPTIAHIKVIG